MKKRYIGLILLFFFLLEGTLFYWILPAEWQTKLMIAPQLAFVGIILIAVLRNRHLALALGLVFGLLHDIVYESPMIGAHGFSMAIVAYAAGATARWFKLNIALTFFIISLSIVFYDSLVFLLYRLFRITSMTFSDLLSQH